MTRPPRARRAGAALRTGLLLAGTVRAVAGGLVVPGHDVLVPLTAEREANTAPVAADDKASMDAGATIQDPAPGLLFNDVDPDGDPLVAMRDSGPSNGTAIVRRDGSWTYTPAPGFVGTDTFTYVASDGLVTSRPATVSITVRGGPAATPVPTPAPTPLPTPAPTPTPVPTISPSPSPSPTVRPGAEASPPTAPPGERAFTIPDPPPSTLELDDIGVEASAIAGLGPVLWTMPTILLAVPGVLVLLAAAGRAGRSRRLAAGRASSGQAGAATRS